MFFHWKVGKPGNIQAFVQNEVLASFQQISRPYSRAFAEQLCCYCLVAPLRPAPAAPPFPRAVDFDRDSGFSRVIVSDPPNFNQFQLDSPYSLVSSRDLLRRLLWR